jgi:GT2 family glycosyltransferase
MVDALRRLLGQPPSDWMGLDPARAAAATAPSPEADDRHEVVALPGSGPEADEALAGLARAGHRVFRVSRRMSSELYRVAEAAPRLFAVMLPPGAKRLEGLDALRRDRGLGATVCVAQDPATLSLARRLEDELAWPRAADPSADLPLLFPRLSIVVVTHGNRDLNRLCLESLLARTEWPNKEVIVVDNGSTDGTPELLAALAARHPALRPVLLAENRGFPAAANAGLAAAEGRYLVLLNNDTVVPRGALTALLRHLARDPALGLVGPVTNAIANEARIPVGYQGLEDLSAWASDWVRAHDGEAFAIPSLAFFCVAMRREVFEKIGPLDERFGIGMFEDGDYCRRVRAAGLAIRCARDAFVHHWQMASFRRLGRAAYLRLFEENRRKFEAKWGPDTQPETQP